MQFGKGKIALSILACGLIGAGFSLSPTPSAQPLSSHNHSLKTIQIALPETVEGVSEKTLGPTLPEIEWRKFTVKKGDSMALIFRRAGEKPGTLLSLIHI